ncbi:hypothetical protein BD779DRAFT_343814 [Infundibulicybe gibba]|nr:hypothetical protein BD779DRAFT_343814 [Infundibulicybe gibba]
MDAEDGDGDGAGLTRKIFPRDYFTLDIFVFNQSTWTRRFEVSWPDARHSRGQGAGGGGNPGVISLDNRVRVGWVFLHLVVSAWMFMAM